MLEAPEIRSTDFDNQWNDEMPILTQEEQYNTQQEHTIADIQERNMVFNNCQNFSFVFNK